MGRTLSQTLPKPIFVLFSINKIKSHVRNTTSVYWNHCSLWSIAIKCTLNAKKKKKKCVGAMIQTMKKKNVGMYWIERNHFNKLSDEILEMILLFIGKPSEETLTRYHSLAKTISRFKSIKWLQRDSNSQPLSSFAN